MKPNHCRHKYASVPGKESPNGYWFRCCYCGHQIFGALRNAT